MECFQKDYNTIIAAIAISIFVFMITTELSKRQLILFSGVLIAPLLIYIALQQEHEQHTIKFMTLSTGFYLILLLIQELMKKKNVEMTHPASW